MFRFKQKGDFNVVEGMVEITPRLSISEVVKATPTVPENINNNTNTDNEEKRNPLYLKQSSYLKKLIGDFNDSLGRK